MAENTAPDTAATDVPEPSAATGGEGGGSAGAKATGAKPNEGWRTSVPSEYREKLSGYESMAAFMADAVDAIDARKSSSQQRDGDDAAVGVPESPDGYDLPGDGAVVDAFRSKAHEIGLSQEAATDLYQWYQEANTEAMRAQADQVEKQLRDEWGGKYDGNVVTVQRFMQSNADPEFQEFLEDTGLGNDPRMIRFVHKVAARMFEDSLVDSGPAQRKLTDEEKLKADYPSHAEMGW